MDADYVRDEVRKVRDYIAEVDGERWADDVSAEHIENHVYLARRFVRRSGKSRGWLGIVHGALKREREAGSRVE